MTRPTPCRPAALLALVLAAMAFQPVAAQVYQWKDANGVTHYSDAPPANADYQNRSINSHAPAPADADEAAAPAESAQCISARSNLALLADERPVGVDNDGDGKPDATLDDGQRAAQKQLAEAAIKVHCAPAATPEA